MVGLALAVAACGDDDEASTATTSERSTTTVPEEVAGLDAFLVGDALAGLSPRGEPSVLTPLEAYVGAYGIPEAEEQRLRDQGFRASVTYPLDSASGESAGISVIDLFATEEGAAAELAYLVEHKESDAPAEVTGFERFDVPGVPGAAGWTFDKPGGSRAADLHWVQGRCLMSLGSEPPVVADLQAAAKAIYDRSGGTCP